MGSAGVSQATWALAAVATTGWFVWAVGERAGASLVTNAVCSPLAWLVFATLTWRQRQHTRLVVVAVAAGVVGVGVALWPAAVAMGLALTGPASNAPQLVKAWRAPDVSGVSMSAWVNAVVAQAAWFAWGLLGGFTAVWVGAGLSVLQAAAICAAVLYRSTKTATQRHVAETSR
jgi:uncharacterized protein with PQ loop repeat